MTIKFSDYNMTTELELEKNGIGVDITITNWETKENKNIALNVEELRSFIGQLLRIQSELLKEGKS